MPIVYDNEDYYNPEKPIDPETVSAVRSALCRLDVGDRVEYSIRTQQNVPSELTVVEVRRRDDGNGVRLQVHLRGPRGGDYYLTDHPKDECPHAISASDDSHGPQGPLLGLNFRVHSDHSITD